MLIQCFLVPACFAVVSVEFSDTRYVVQEGQNITVCGGGGGQLLSDSAAAGVH